jgi:DNA-binding transcriptional MerR regulator
MPDNHQAVHGTGAVARRAGLTTQRLQYLIEKGKLPAASLTIPGRRLFTASDLERILQALRADPSLAAWREPEAGSSEGSGGS